MKKVEGRWVTINGTHVFIGANGRVSKGPKNMIGLTQEGATKKANNPKSRPDKKLHEGRKSSYRKNLEKDAGYSEKRAKQADKNMKEYFKLSPEQQEVYSAAYSEYFKTHKNPNGTTANTYAIKVAKSAKAQKMIKSAKENRAVIQAILKSESLSAPKGYKLNTETGRYEKVKTQSKQAAKSNNAKVVSNPHTKLHTGRTRDSGVLNEKQQQIYNEYKDSGKTTHSKAYWRALNGIPLEGGKFSLDSAATRNAIHNTKSYKSLFDNATKTTSTRSGRKK